MWARANLGSFTRRADKSESPARQRAGFLLTEVLDGFIVGIEGDLFSEERSVDMKQFWRHRLFACVARLPLFSDTSTESGVVTHTVTFLGRGNPEGSDFAEFSVILDGKRVSIRKSFDGRDEFALRGTLVLFRNGRAAERLPGALLCRGDYAWDKYLEGKVFLPFLRVDVADRRFLSTGVRVKVKCVPLSAFARSLARQYGCTREEASPAQRVFEAAE